MPAKALSPDPAHRPVAEPDRPAPDTAQLLSAALAQAVDGPGEPSATARFEAAAAVIRAGLARRWLATQAADAARADTVRRVHYLSMEFLVGRALRNAVDALALAEPLARALGTDRAGLDALMALEQDAALGNGGLGRLAACFLDSMATLGMPSFGYGLFYRYGMFAQALQDGRQVERPDDWLPGGGAALMLARPQRAWRVGFGGRLVADGPARRWMPSETVRAVAQDFIVPGHGTDHVSTLRLWQAESEHSPDLARFGRGEHQTAGAHLLEAQALTWVLYPDDATAEGRALRLKQEYLLCSASLQDMLARHLAERGAAETFGRHNTVHLNDTHPALAVPELMRLLMDEHGQDWDAAWAVTQQAVSYTNHTLMPEALETWPVALMEALLPRHLEIIYGINHRMLQDVRARHPGDDALVQRLSLIDERGERRVRMAHLAVVASHRVNGVSALHSALCVDTLFADQARLWPHRFINITNGVTPRRWLAQANPQLAGLIDRSIGDAWRQDLAELSRLGAKAGRADLGAALRQVKRANKAALAARIRRELGLVVDPDSLFDVHAKRIHEYKRQLLNLLSVVARWQAIVAEPHRDWVPRTVVFAGKAASGYAMAKQIIALIHDVARVVNSDARVGDRLKLAFLPDYGVALAEALIPAADLSQQISTAGTEASGTGNMKFALNGALTIGTWDGANIEMAQSIGEDALFIFGLRSAQVAALKAAGYDARLHAEENLELRAVLAAIGAGTFARGDATSHRALVQGLLQHDPYLLLADFADYQRAQAAVDALWREPARWDARVARNIAGMGPFSTDRTIAQYRDMVWRAPER